MGYISLIPEPHQVWNEFDSHGVLVGLPRLEEEKNVSYKQRLMDVFVHRANSTPRGLIYGITRELGLKIEKVIKITMQLNNGVPVLPLPAVVFQDTKCILYSDFSAGTILYQFDRWEIEQDTFTLGNLVDAINGIDNFSAVLLPHADPNGRALTCFDQSSIEWVLTESIANGGPRIQLAHQHLIPGTVSVASNSLLRQVPTTNDILREGDYCVSMVDGTIYSSVVPDPGSIIRYQYAKYDFEVEASPIVMHNLQSTDFQQKMFQTVSGELGLPTALGADIVNELLSVYPTTWGK